jgi:hypothetical protein
VDHQKKADGEVARPQLPDDWLPKSCSRSGLMNQTAARSPLRSSYRTSLEPHGHGSFRPTLEAGCQASVPRSYEQWRHPLMAML